MTGASKATSHSPLRVNRPYLEVTDIKLLPEVSEPGDHITPAVTLAAILLTDPTRPLTRLAERPRVGRGHRTEPVDGRVNGTRELRRSRTDALQHIVT